MKNNDNKYHRIVSKMLSQSVGQKRSIAVFSMKRSGQHAIIDWILSGYSNSYLFLNDVRMNSDPFLSTNGLIPFKSNRIYHYFPSSIVRKCLPRKLLVYNFEDPDLEQIYNLNKNIGKSERHDNILILRDIFNCFASRRKGLSRYIDESRTSFLIKELWKVHANEYLGATNYLGNDCIKISYNDFIFSNNYREKCSKLLGIKCSYLSDYPSREGGGSSFSHLNKLNHSNLLARYSNLQEYQDVIRIIKDDKELIDLNFQIFHSTLSDYKNEIRNMFR
jgi:hypothetical protein